MKTSDKSSSKTKPGLIECQFCHEEFGEETYKNDKKYREHLKTIHMKPCGKSNEGRERVKEWWIIKIQ